MSTSATPCRSSRTSPTRSRRRIRDMAEPGEDGNAPDVVITEVGGTVGDIESLPFLEAARQVRHDVGRDNCFFLHVSLVPYLAPSGELKTKPTQHSVAALRNIGIQPDAIVCRADREIPERAQAQDRADVRRGHRRRRRRAGRAVDLRHPEGAAHRGPRRLRRPPARTAVPRRGLDGVGRPARPACTIPRRRCGSRSSASTSTCPTRTCRSPRRCVPAGSPTAPRSRSCGSRPTTCETPAGAARRAVRPGRRADPRRVRRARHRGQDRRDPVRPHQQDPGARAVPRPAVHGDRGRAAPRRASTDANSVGVRRGHQAPGDLHDGRPGGRRRRRAGHGRHDAARRVPGEARRRARWSRTPTGRRRCPSGTATATRSTTPTATSCPRPASCSPGSSPDGHLVEFVELPRRRAPVLRRHAGAPGAEEPSDAAAPAVRRLRAGRAGYARRPSGCRWSCRSRPALERVRDRAWSARLHRTVHNGRLRRTHRRVARRRSRDAGRRSRRAARSSSTTARSRSSRWTTTTR